jgi:hypothetical protein
MPEISRFLGMIIAIFYKDHSPPHFHAKYGEYDITVEIIRRCQWRVSEKSAIPRVGMA